MEFSNLSYLLIDGNVCFPSPTVPFQTVIKGDATWESLKYVQYKGPEILKQVQETLEKKVATRKVSFEETSHFIELLDKMLVSYTYLGE